MDADHYLESTLSKKNSSPAFRSSISRHPPAQCIFSRFQIFQGRFPLIFAISDSPEALICQVLSDEGWIIRFRRCLGPAELMQWQQLQVEIEGISLSSDRDTVSWSLTASAIFSTNSLYRKLCSGVQFPCLKNIWQATVPLKIRIFLWQLARGRLPANDQIALRQGPSNGQCALCGDLEDTDHIFFGCVLPVFVWAGLREFLQVSWNPSNFQDLCSILAGFTGNSRRVMRVLIAAVCWSLWLIRNKYTIEAKFPKQPADCVFKIMMHLQLWRPLLKDDAATLMEELIAVLKALFDATYSRPSQA